MSAKEKYEDLNVCCLSPLLAVIIPTYVIGYIAMNSSMHHNTIAGYWIVSLICVYAISRGVINQIILNYDEKRQMEETQLKMEEEERYTKQQQKQQLLMEKRRQEREQKDKYNQLVKYGEVALACFKCLPDNLVAAENHLDKAENDFKERLFIPFWDSIERATSELGKYNDNIKYINSMIASYESLKPSYHGKAPAFPLFVNTLQKTNVSEGTTQRLNKIVRIAHQDDKFASIFLQIRTNKILVAGFTNLGDAIENMDLRINTSIHELNEAIERNVSQMNYSLEEIGSDVVNEIQKTSIMLDNIQRHRKPD